jgi:C4-dicarboxylate transporter DctM subunit
MIVGVGIGLFTPPVGVALYAMQDFTKTSFGDVVAAVLPWLLPLIGALFVITYVPWIALALPRALGY